MLIDKLGVTAQKTLRMLLKFSATLFVNSNEMFYTGSNAKLEMFIPVVDQNQKPLMPTSPRRARRMMESGKATGFWKRGVFCVRLNMEPSARNIQNIAVGIDPGSKREGFSVKSEAHTFLNIQAVAVSYVKDKVATRRMLRRGRRSRNTPYRACRSNRRGGFRLPPSTRARWGWKLRIATWLSKMFPINAFVVEDIQARSIKGARRWNMSFSPLEYGKKWFYEQLARLGRLELRQGYETHELRTELGLPKTKDKLAKKFSAHCVDAWVLANDFVGGHVKPENERVLFLEPIQFQRRNLRAQTFAKSGVRRRMGGTMSLGLKKGRLAKHIKHGICYIGGNMKGLLTICNVATGARIARNVRTEDLRLLAYNSWRFA